MKTALGMDVINLDKQGLTTAEIAETLEIEEILVKSVLMSQGRGKDEEEVEELVSKDEVKEFIEGYKSIARFAENENVRERALKALINMGRGITDGLGENNVREIMKEAGANCNILQLNAVILSAREAKKMAIEGVKKMTMIEDTESVVNGNGE